MRTPTAPTSAARPTHDETWDTLRLLRDILGRDICYGLRGSFHFVLNDGWTLAISPDAAGRFRLDTCFRSRPRATVWVLARDRERLSRVATEAFASAMAGGDGASPQGMRGPLHAQLRTAT